MHFLTASKIRLEVYEQSCAGHSPRDAVGVEIKSAIEASHCAHEKQFVHLALLSKKIPITGIWDEGT